MYVEPLQKRFKVRVRNAYKQKRNRSLSNASNCCGAKLVQEKKCSVCEGVVQSSECTRKIVKIGKDEHLVNARALQDIRKRMDGDEIRVHTVVSELPEEVQDRFGALLFGMPAKNGELEYRELVEVIGRRVCIGVMAERGNEFEVVVTVGRDGRLRVRKLVEQSQLYDVPDVPQSPIGGEVVALEQQVLEKACVASYDFGVFRDGRAELEEQLIEDVVLHGKRPDEQEELVQKNVEKDAQQEVERLRALLSGG